MGRNEAIEIVLDLAEQNLIDKRDEPEEYERQRKALAMVTRILKG